MELVNVDLSQTPKKAAPKRMLEMAKLSDGRYLVNINNSSISVIQDCMRKAEYLLMRKLVNNIEAEALTAGKAIHKGLEHWYSLPEHLRQLTAHEVEFSDTLTGGPMEMPSHPYETSLDSINEYVKAAQSLQTLDAGDKRGLVNGIKILKAYFAHYLNDGFEIYRDEQGPFVERHFEFKLWEDSSMIINYHGTIDCILQNKNTKEIMVVDHKTTAALGSAFFNRIKPNHQYTGYILAAHKMGINTNQLMVNGIQVAKTKCEFARQITTRGPDDFAELLSIAIDSADRMIKAAESGVYAQNTGACTGFGSCTYIEVCSAPKAMRENIIKNQYSEGGINEKS